MHRAARLGQLREARSAQMGGGAPAGLVRALPPAHGPLRAARRHLRRVPPPRCRSDLPALRRALVLLRMSVLGPRGSAGSTVVPLKQLSLHEMNVLLTVPCLRGIP